MVRGLSAMRLISALVGLAAAASGGGPLSDCNNNGIPDDVDLANCDGSPWCNDCNTNGVIDVCDIGGGTSTDRNADGIPDECQFKVGLVGHWPLNAGTGDTAADASGHGHHGTIFGAQWVPGVAGLGLYFGGNDYVRLPRIALPAEYSVALWLYCDSADTPMAYPLFRGNADNCAYEPSLWSYPAVQLGATSTRDCGAGTAYTHLSGTHATHTWIHVAYTVAADGERMFIDGVEIPRVATHAHGASNYFTLLGAYANQDDGQPDGGYLEHTRLDEIRMYDRALPFADVIGLYALHGPDCNLNGVLDLLDIQGGVSFDTNGNGVPDECDLCQGDCDCDGVVNWRDIDYFVAAMNDNELAWRALFPTPGPICPFENCDVDGSGTIDWRDIDPFVARINTVCAY